MKCPNCHQETTWQDNPYRPFCCERCQLIDLGEWAKGNYRIGGGPQSEEEFNHEDHEGHEGSE